MRKEKLEEFNEWWFTGNVPGELAKRNKRRLFYEIAKFLGRRQIISVTGLRRVGKTTIMYQLIEMLLGKNVDKTTILYFNFDEKAENLDDVIDTYRENHDVDFRKQKAYIFLDEIQKLDNWANQVKKYYDLYPKVKFVISGSESLFLFQKAKETLAGRAYEFLLKPLSFLEYLEFRGFDIKSTSTLKMKRIFVDFIRKGGFPEMLGKTYSEIKMYVKSAVIDKIIFQDIAKAGIKDTDLLKTLIEIIAVNPGIYLEYNSLAKQLDRDRRVIKSYINLLEQSFLLKILHNYRKGRLASLRKIKKAYLTDTSLILAYKPVVDDQFFGKLVESAVVNHSISGAFWKNSHEVDLVEDMPIEIKYKSKIIDNDLLGLREFMRKFSFRGSILLTKDEEGKITVREGTIILKPIWKYLLEPRKYTE